MIHRQRWVKRPKKVFERQCAQKTQKNLAVLSMSVSEDL
jgi:hypothetical protein